MSTVDVEAQANQAAAQGQSMLDQDNANAAQYKNSYDSYQGQADAANKNVADYTDYMRNEGSAGNQYDSALKSQLGDLGYDQGQMTAARTNLNQATGALSAYSDFANTGASKFGLNAGGFAAANSGALAGLNNNIASNQQVANGLSSLYTQAQTGANQRTGQVVQGEQNTLGAYQQQFANASSSRDAAGQQMNFWANLAQTQGGLNAQQAQAYASARAAYSASTASLASARNSIAQAQLSEQQFTHQQDLYKNDAVAAAAQTANTNRANNPQYLPGYSQQNVGGSHIAVPNF